MSTYVCTTSAWAVYSSPLCLQNVARCPLRMYCIVRPMVPENNVPCTYHCLHVLSILANSGVNRMSSQGRKLTTVKHKCYAKITMQYILKSVHTIKHDIFATRKFCEFGSQTFSCQKNQLAFSENQQGISSTTGCILAVTLQGWNWLILTIFLQLWALM